MKIGINRCKDSAKRDGDGGGERGYLVGIVAHDKDLGCLEIISCD